MNGGEVHVIHKVRFVGNYYSDTKLTESIVKNIVQHSSKETGQKLSLRLCSDGLRIDKSTFFSRGRRPLSIPLKDLLMIGRHKSNPTNLFCVVNDTTSQYTKIVLFRCSKASDAADYAETYLKWKKLSESNGFINQTTTIGGYFDADRSVQLTKIGKSKMSEQKRHDEFGDKHSGDRVFIATRQNEHSTNTNNSNYREHSTGIEMSNTDYIYAIPRKRSEKIVSDATDSSSTGLRRNFQHIGAENVADGQEYNEFSEHKSLSNERLRREIEDLKRLVRKSLDVIETHSVSGDTLRSTKSEEAAKHSENSVIQNSSASRREDEVTQNTKLTRHSKFVTRYTKGNRHTDSDSTSIQEANDTRYGEAKIPVSDFYSHYATMTRDNEKARMGQRTELERASSMAGEISGIKATKAYNNRQRNMYYSGDGNNEASSSFVYRTNTFNGGSFNPRSKVTFKTKPSHDDIIRYHGSSVVPKPIEHVYATYHAGRQSGAYVGSPKPSRNVHPKVRIIPNQPMYLVNPSNVTAEQIIAEDIKRTK